VKQEWRDVVGTATALGMYTIKLLSVAAGTHITAICTCRRPLRLRRRDTQVIKSIGIGIGLGHGGGEHAQELSPRLVEALVGKSVAAVAWQVVFTQQCGPRRESSSPLGTRAGRRLGHGGQQDELVPQLVKALVGKSVVGAAAGQYHTAVWTDAGERFTFGGGIHGRLGHGGTQHASVPRLVEALAGDGDWCSSRF
jgi:hypothetical protein